MKVLFVFSTVAEINKKDLHSPLFPESISFNDNASNKGGTKVLKSGINANAAGRF